MYSEGTTTSNKHMQPNSTTPSPNVTTASGGKKKTLLIAILGGFLAAFTSGATAYGVLNTTTEKILRDSFYNTTRQQTGSYSGSYSTYAGQDSVTVAIVGEWTKNAMSGDVSLQGRLFREQTYAASFVGKDDSFYVQLKGVKDVMMQLSDGDPAAMSMYGSLIELVDNKWVVITEKDIEELTGQPADKKRTQCVQQALEALQTDKKQQREVFDLYKRNPFLILTKQPDEVIGDRGAYRFSVRVASDKGDAFVKGLVNTTAYKNVNKCVDPEGKNSSITQGIEKNFTEHKKADKSTLDIWIDKSSRTLRNVVVTAKDDNAKDQAKFETTLGFKTPVSISVPRADTDVKTLKTEYEKLSTKLRAQYSQQAPVLGETTAAPANSPLWRLEDVFGSKPAVQPTVPAVMPGTSTSRVR